uniref:Peptidase S1 domain-containing protein n=1 Tax=Romanomermis culicivorax TaxID=13658 RepID=A0A915JVU1_ROMCU
MIAPIQDNIISTLYDAGWQEIDRTEIKVKDVLIHPQFNGHSYTEMDNFDIAMVKLENPVYLNDQVVDKVEQIPDNGSLSDSIDCWVRGQGRWNHTLIDIKQLIEESATLTTPSLPGSSSISYLVSLGAPLICQKDHITGVYGITVRRQREIDSLVFVSLAAHKVWIQKAIDGEIDVLKKPFHKDLYNQSEYVVREMEAFDRHDVELEELTREQELSTNRAQVNEIRWESESEFLTQFKAIKI